MRDCTVVVSSALVSNSLKVEFRFKYYFAVYTVVKTSCVDHKDRNDMWPTAASQFPQQFPSYSNCKCKKIAVFTYRSHVIFVSPGDAPAIITQYVAWMERQFNACQTPRSM